MKDIIAVVCAIMLIGSLIALGGIIGSLEQDVVNMQEAIIGSIISLVFLFLAMLGIGYVTKDEEVTRLTRL